MYLSWTVKSVSSGCCAGFGNMMHLWKCRKQLLSCIASRGRLISLSVCKRSQGVMVLVTTVWCVLYMKNFKQNTTSIKIYNVTLYYIL